MSYFGIRSVFLICQAKAMRCKKGMKTKSFFVIFMSCCFNENSVEFNKKLYFNKTEISHMTEMNEWVVFLYFKSAKLAKYFIKHPIWTIYFKGGVPSFFLFSMRRVK